MTYKITNVELRAKAFGKRGLMLILGSRSGVTCNYRTYKVVPLGEKRSVLGVDLFLEYEALKLIKNKN